MSDVTRMLNAIEGGDQKAAEELLPLVYEELRLLAARKMAQERPGHTLQATALVHEAYLRLVDAPNVRWESRGHFFKAAAEAMLRILVERARRKNSLRQGGHKKRVQLDHSIQVTPADIPPEDLLTFNEALEKLAAKDRTKSDLVKLRIFAGLSGKQAAEILGISQAKASEDLAYARAWLCLEINRDESDSRE